MREELIKTRRLIKIKRLDSQIALSEECRKTFLIRRVTFRRK